ncbi:unnamed protein product [Parajaminaea phylloscopi]
MAAGSAVNMSNLFNLPPPLDFDAIRRRQRAMTAQMNAQSATKRQGQRDSPLAHTNLTHVQQASAHPNPPAVGHQQDPEALQAALNHFFGSHAGQQQLSHQQAHHDQHHQAPQQSSQHPAFSPSTASASSQQAHTAPGSHAPATTSFAHQSNLVGSLLESMNSAQPLQQQQHHNHHHQQLHHHHQQPPRLHATHHHPHHQQQPDQQPMHSNVNTHHAQQAQQHMSAHQAQAPTQHASAGPHGPQSMSFHSSPEEHACLLNSASESFNNFALEMGRSQQAALQLQYVEPALATCISGVKTAAQTLCADLTNISAALRAMTTSGSSTPTAAWRHSKGLSAKSTQPSSGPSWSGDLATMFNQLQSQHGMAGSSRSSPMPAERTAPCMHSQTPGGTGGPSGAQNVDSEGLLTFLDHSSALPSGFPPGPAEQMLDFLTAPSSGTAHDVNSRAHSSHGDSATASPGNASKKRKEGPGSPPASPASAAPLAAKIQKASGKHKSRPPIEGVRRESVRYRNRKLLVDMREQLYKWLDTTEFCRIARSFPQGLNGWTTVPVNIERPELGTKRIFQPNFEVGSDLYVCNKELLEELIELGVQKVKDRPEAYGMKEGVEAKDVVVDVAKDLMDSARHGYRANLKKQQEDEADAKAKSTRYKQQERHRTKVRNREVGAKRLKHPIPDSLLTMGLHSDDAASDQEDMHKMDKEDWRKLRMRKLQSKRGWEALAPRWRNTHLTKAYHIADTLSKSKQMPRWRRDGGIDLDPPMRLWGKTLPKVVFDPAWLLENEARIREDPFNIKVEDKEVHGWRDEDHSLSDDTEDELERYEREMTRLNRANRKRTAGTAPSLSLFSPHPGSGPGTPTAYSGNGHLPNSERSRRGSSDMSSVPPEEQRGRRTAIGSNRASNHSADSHRQSSLGSSAYRSGTSASSLNRRHDDRFHSSVTSKEDEDGRSADGGETKDYPGGMGQRLHSRERSPHIFRPFDAPRSHAAATIAEEAEVPGHKNPNIGMMPTAAHML